MSEGGHRAAGSVRVEGLNKTYRVYRRPLDRLLEWITRRSHHQPFEALRDISFEVPPGESLGIVGENGAGKSTLLKILSGISRPSAGLVEVPGRIASILELGSGFHPEFSGRDNIRINAALLGLTEERVEATLPDIVEFSELGAFIERPVKVYSTGMTMRLAFSIATQVSPQVLIVDEALSVGDGYFQKKCMDRMVELVDSGMTLLFCTHAMYYLTSFCHRAIWLREGRMEACGPAREVVAQYERFLQQKQRHAAPQQKVEASEDLVDLVERVADEVGAASSPAKAGRIRAVRAIEVPDPGDGHDAARRLVVEVEIEARDPEVALQVGLGLDRSDGTQVLSVSTHRGTSQEVFGPLRGSTEYRLRATIEPLPLQQGLFSLYVFLLDEAGLHVWDQHTETSLFDLDPGEYRIGLFEVPCRFELV